MSSASPGNFPDSCNNTDPKIKLEFEFKHIINCFFFSGVDSSAKKYSNKVMNNKKKLNVSNVEKRGEVIC